MSSASPSIANSSQRLAFLSVPALALLWGLNWPAVKVMLSVWSPWAVRGIGLGCGALILLAFAFYRGQPLMLPRASRWRVLVSALLTVVLFNLCVAFAQTQGSTSRAAIVTFVMPIWTVLLAWPILGEKPTRTTLIAMGLALCGLALLGLPLLTSGASLIGVVLALLAGFSWAAGTVFVKRFPLGVAPLVAASWQLGLGAAVATLGWGLCQIGNLPTPATPADQLWLQDWFWLALPYHAVMSSALAYLIWFDVITKLPATVAAMGSLLIPMVGVGSAMGLLGERPSVTDLGGFAFISAAAALTLIKR